MSARDPPLHRHFSIPSLEHKCGLDHVLETRRAGYYFRFAISNRSSRLDLDRCRCSQPHHQHTDHLGAGYNVYHLSIQLSYHLVLLGLPGRGLQGSQ